MTVPSKMIRMWTTMGSTLASFMFTWAIIWQYCPGWIRQSLDKYKHRIMAFLHPYVEITFYKFSSDDRFRTSEAYDAVEAYLSVNTSKSAKNLKAEMGNDSKSLVLSLDEYERVTDEYNGVKVWWNSGKIAPPSRSMSFYPAPENGYYALTFHKRYREIITESYLKHIIKEGNEVMSSRRQRKLYTNASGNGWNYKETMWSHIAFEHPATFESIALEPEKKKEIVEDLLTFSKSKEFYARIGKAWKRGYLLYGPPGTGKSTMIAAMANLLDYDIYDLELTAVKDNMELRKLLIETTGKSIIVIEDIDCSLDLTGQRMKKCRKDDDTEKVNKIPIKEPSEDNPSKVTLSGLLNFIDGLWSACGGERLIVFTTNHVENLDPALIRRGRMDMHIELSYCSFEAFKVLAKNYLSIDSHPMFDEVRHLIGEVKITPADVAENSMPKSPTDNAEKCLLRLVQALKDAKETAAAKKCEESKVDPAREGDGLAKKNKKNRKKLRERNALAED